MSIQIIFQLLWFPGEYQKSAINSQHCSIYFWPWFSIPHVHHYKFNASHGQSFLLFFACFALSPFLQGSHFPSSFVQSSLLKFATVFSPIINVNLIFSLLQPGDSLSSSWWNTQVPLFFQTASLSLCFF